MEGRKEWKKRRTERGNREAEKRKRKKINEESGKGRKAKKKTEKRKNSERSGKEEKNIMLFCIIKLIEYKIKLYRDIKNVMVLKNQKKC